MKLWISTLRLAGRSLRRNPLRSALTSLGVVVGVAAVIAMVSVGQGAHARLQEQLASVGTNIVMVFPGATSSSGSRAGWGTADPLTVADARAIERQDAKIERAGVQPVYLITPIVIPESKTKDAAQKGIIETLFAYDDPQEYAEFYRVENRWDEYHLNKISAADFTTMFARDFAAFVEGKR